MTDPRPAFAESTAGPPVLDDGGSRSGNEGFDEEPPVVPGSFLSALPQFFVFPAILVATLAAVYLVLRALAGAAPEDARLLLDDLKVAGPHGRWQVLYSLSDGLRRGSLDLEGVETAELASLYETMTADEAGGEQASLMRQHLLLVLAHKRDPELTWYALDALESGDGALRRGALQALATMADPAAMGALGGFLGGEDADERLLALGALGSTDDTWADELVAGLFLDQDTILARNAVLLRARDGDARAAPFLISMLDRASYAGDARLDGDVPGMDEASREVSRAEATEAFLIEAAKAAGALGDGALAEPLQTLREGDPSLKVRSAAIDALHALGANE